MSKLRHLACLCVWFVAISKTLNFQCLLTARNYSYPSSLAIYLLLAPFCGANKLDIACSLLPFFLSSWDNITPCENGPKSAGRWESPEMKLGPRLKPAAVIVCRNISNDDAHTVACIYLRKIFFSVYSFCGGPLSRKVLTRSYTPPPLW